MEYFGIWIDVEGKLQGLEVNPGRGTRGPWGQIWNIQIEKRLSRIQANRHKYTQELKHIDTCIETHRHKHWNTKTQALKHIDTNIVTHTKKYTNISIHKREASLKQNTQIICLQTKIPSYIIYQEEPCSHYHYFHRLNSRWLRCPLIVIYGLSLCPLPVPVIKYRNLCFPSQTCTAGDTFLF